ncbi:uncharacterized protein LACBIDRAFT_333892 [Laccaria bicolor S238N-H82]|uniref:Predicted protein n=1 Tax=Laccaria bicolor (strain S238N-H82 / ATCC MYA-4686) TaxID=486041 RepID=B0DL11_LACBS|nr:uncharacterized protein LACBIDRAFT_330385 [Laccaria bicolor S238N-H82]XP_001884655.1 uncharacterized protein LACBIDRAFT_330350 [Laccaria bicolor S238N-H82]XP_001888675.1 uncharacterized protein LACBIDRAFT_333892 [Laccaria bicolor S238N-H82]EDR00666.1 predicted protein [Laccaria bicolor S238N-H82]EDR04767.1 predicted protein [Laccaria bicolor S238N-H82]EDR04831.1 predicted protein [Laccaria bicolor S238N-H82]|eukprot:XP_001884591.1 predicted protein [Laccaria bicolor S238N-H82]
MPTDVYQQIHLKVLYFSMSSRNARPISIPALVSPSGERFPVLSTALSEYPTITPSTTLISLKTRHRKQYNFTVYHRYDEGMIRNRAAAAIAPEVHWAGDLLLVREGSRVNFTDLSNRDISFAKTAVRRQTNIGVLSSSSNSR